MTPKGLIQYLGEAGVEASLMEFESPVRTVRAASELSGVSPDGIVKSLVVMDPKGTAYLCLVPGHRRLSLSKAAKALGVQSLRLAKAKEVLRETGYEAGALPPVGHTRRLRVLMERGLVDLDKIVAGGGSTRSLLEVSPLDVEKLTGAQLADLYEG